MSLASTIATSLRNLWASLRSLQSEVRRVNRDLAVVQRFQKKNTDLLVPGVKEYGPLATPHQLVFLEIKTFVGGTPALWDAKRQMLGAGGFEDDDEDTATYVVDQEPGANGVFEGSFVFAIFDRLDPGPPEEAIYRVVATETIRFMGKAVCTPPGLDDLTNEVYYVELRSILAAAPGDPAPPIVLDVVPIVVGTASNSEEVNTHTHGVRVGSTFPVEIHADNAGKPRWVFAATPLIMVSLLGGVFGSFGMARVDNQALFRQDAWDKKNNPKFQFNNAGAPDFQGIGLISDRIVFEGTWWVVGELSLPGEFGGGPKGYGFARWDWDTEKWVGVLFQSGENASNGTFLFVWDSGNGKKLYVQQQTSTAPIGKKVKEITYNPTTKVVTVTDIGWNAVMGSGSTVVDAFAYDDGTDEKIHFIGVFTTGTFWHHVHWDGTTFGNYGNMPLKNGNYISGYCIHDFEDGNGPMIVFSGKRRPAGGPDLSPVWRWNHRALQFEDVGTLSALGFAVTQESVTCESCNKRIWVGFVDIPTFQRPPLYAINNGPHSDWTRVENIVKDMAGNSLWLFWWNGSSNVRRNAGVATLVRYGKRLAVGGNMNFITVRRGLVRSGPCVYYDAASDTWNRVLPIVSGEVKAIIAYNGGALLCGNIRGSFTGGVTIVGLGVWHDPGILGGVGTWESIGDVIGTIYAAVMLNGNLHIFGDITSAGGVEVQGHAWKDEAGWHKGVTITGTARTAVVAGSRIIVGGAIFKVNGNALYKVVFGWDGTTLTTVTTFDDFDIDAANGLPFVNGLFVDDGFLYMVGWFDRLGILLNVLANSIARMDLTTFIWEPLLDDDSPPSNGIVNGRVAHSVGSSGTRIWVGTDGDASVGKWDSLPRGLWEWNPASPSWFPSPDLVISNGPTLAISSDPAGGQILASLDGENIGLSDGLGPTHAVYEIPSNTALGGTTNSHHFDSPITAIATLDAGAGTKPFAGGSFQSVGTAIAAPASRVAGMCFMIDENDRLVDMPGGLGVTVYQDQFTTAQGVGRMRVLKLPNPDQTVYQSTLNAVQTAWMDESDPDTAKGGSPLTLGRPVAGKGARPLASFLSSGVSGEVLTAKIKLPGGTGATFADLCKLLRLRVDYDPSTVTFNDREPPGKPWSSPGASDTSADIVNAHKASLTMPTDDDTEVEVDVLAMYQDFIDEMENGGSPVFGIMLRDDDESSASINVWEILAGITLAVTYIPSECGLSISCTGAFAVSGDGYSQYLVGINLKGELVGLRGGLSGSFLKDQPFGFDGVNHPVAVPESKWPAYWHNIIDNCQPHMGYAWLIFGSFNHGLNEAIGDDDLGTVGEDIEVLGVALLSGGHLYKVTAAGALGYARTGEVCNGKIILTGGFQAPHEYTGDENSGSWTLLKPHETDGAIYGPNGSISRMLDFEGLLWMVGNPPIYPDTTTHYGILHWDGEDYTPFEPPGWLKGPPGTVHGRCLILSKIDGTEKLYAGGLANVNQCPVIKRTGPGTGTWTAVGGASQLRGDCLTLSAMEGPAGGDILLATGLLLVDEGDGFQSVDAAYYDGTSWKKAGWFNNSVSTRANANIGDNAGHADCEVGPQGVRGLVGGSMSEVAETQLDLGTPQAVQCFGIVQYQMAPTKWITMPGGGVDGIVMSMASAQRYLWPDEV